MRFKEIITATTSKFSPWLRYRPTAKQLGIIAATIVGLVVVINLAMAWYYQDRYYPNLSAGATDVGGMTPTRARQVLADVIDRRPLTLSFDSEVLKIPTKSLGVEYDLDATLAELNAQLKPSIPILSLLPNQRSSEIPLSLQVNESVLSNKIDDLIDSQKADPVDAKLTLKDGKAAIEPHQSGRMYNSRDVRAEVLKGLTRLSPTPMPVTHQEIPVKVTTSDLKSALEQSKQKLGIQIVLTYGEKRFTPSRAEIGSWLSINDQLSLSVEGGKVAEYIEQVAEEIDIEVKNEAITTLDGIETGRQSGQSGQSLNRSDTSKAIIQALEKTQSVEYELKVDAVEPTVEYIRKYSFSGLNYSYCVRSNGVDDAMLGYFSQKISSTLADNRGWGMDGRIKFSPVASGCSFNLVLAAASTLPSYSSACSIYWSCRVGSNVIINVNRWTGASDSWNQAGGSLDEYQSMVINHEVGHWLGLDHWSCGGSGQPAPVMLQQSIDLQSCAFNAWPTAAELTHLRNLKGF